MSGIKYVITTELFWKTLSDYRRHGNYATLRDRIDNTVFRKAQDRTYRTPHDKPFSNAGKLKDIWHTHLSKEFDAVLFYTMADDDLTLVAVGNHGDYPNGDRNKSKAGPLAERLWNSIATGHSPSPAWQKLKWSHPSDLLRCRDLHEMDARILADIRQDLRNEMDTMARFERLTGLDHLADGNIEAVIEYIEVVEKADNLLTDASVRAELSFTKYKRAIPVKDLQFNC
jgi:mRNA-degrading endonuclease YafQ of YafQ-DinJ toxin-antitoxin module